MVKISDSNQNINWDIPCTILIMGVGALGHIEMLAEFRLCQIGIFTQIFDSVENNSSSFFNIFLI